MNRLAYLLRHVLLRLRYRCHGTPYGHTALTDPANEGGRILDGDA